MKAEPFVAAGGEGGVPASSGDATGEGEKAVASRRTSRKRWLLRAGQLLLTVIVTAFILQRVGLSLDEVRVLDPARWRPDMPLLALASLLLFAGYLLSACYWGRMTVEMGGGDFHLRRACQIYFTANLGRYVPGKVLQIAGLAFLAGRAGVSSSIALAAAVVGQGLTLMGAALVGLLAFRTLDGMDAEAWGPFGFVVALGALVILVVVSVPSLFRGSIELVSRALQTSAVPPLRVRPTFGARWTLLYTANWVVQAAAFWVLAGSLGVEGTFLEMGPAFAAAYLLGYLAVFAPAGIGVREGFLVAFLEPVTGAAAALGLAVIARLWMTVVELVPAVWFARSELRVRKGRGKGG